MSQLHLPTVNAILNAITTIFLFAGFVFIRRQRIPAHRFCMTTALLTSSLFLISYLTHHALHGSTRFQGVGMIRTIYFTILISHTFLAAVIVPMVLITITKAWKGLYENHRRVARWTWPLWMYVSVTGVVIYWMLYRLPVS